MEPIATFTIPLDMAPTANTWGRSANAAGWQRARVKDRCWKAMLTQFMLQFRTVPPSSAPVVKELFPRRRVVCTRRSSSEPDRYAGWSKVPVDLLQMPGGNRKRGLGLIWDDSPKCTDVEERWEKAPPRSGEVLIEVFEC
jgi:hypothetical protein